MNDSAKVSSHTPGTWRVDETVALGAYGVWADYPVNDTNQGQVCSVYPGNQSDFPREMRDANARLIAAAPDLLAWMLDVLSREPERFSNSELDEAERIGFKIGL